MKQMPINREQTGWSMDIKRRLRELKASDFPRRAYLTLQEKAWTGFLDGMVSVGVTKVCSEAVSRYGARAVHISHAVDTEVFRPGPSGRDIADRVRVLFVGNLLQLKGIHIIMEMITGRQWRSTEFCFVRTGPYEAQIRDLERSGYPVKCLGPVHYRNGLSGIYRRADMLTLPSIRIGREEEKFGIVLVEAMACQLPVIATDCIGPREIVDDGETGLLIPQHEVRAFSVDGASRET
jgi:glycosyltransferase involved in cell wall biosynthesis